jgi:hypothetical protein
MSSRPKTSKRRKAQVSVYEFPEEGSGSHQPAAPAGYQEIHTEYLQKKDGVVESKHVVYVPPSPSKPSTSQPSKRRRSPSADEDPSVPVPPSGNSLDAVEDHGAYSSLWMGDTSDEGDSEGDDHEAGPQKKRRRTKGVSLVLLRAAVYADAVQSNPLTVFTEHADMMLDELLRLEGLGAPGLRCFRCKTTEADCYYRCKDCTVPMLQCHSCLVCAHTSCFTHRVEVCTLPI